jgi:hypothetical protein
VELAGDEEARREKHRRKTPSRWQTWKEDAEEEAWEEEE